MEKTPFEILGIKSKIPTKREIKRQYQKLLAVEKQKLNKLDEPLKELVESRIEEIENAYRELMKNYDKIVSDLLYREIKELLLQDKLLEAMKILMKNFVDVPMWYYMVGCVLLYTANVQSAWRYFAEAYIRDPFNWEYREAVRMFSLPSRIKRKIERLADRTRRKKSAPKRIA